MVLDYQKVTQKFSELVSLDVKKEEEKRQARKNLFEKVVYQSTGGKDIESVQTEELVSMLSEVDGFLGGKFSMQVDMENFMDCLLRTDSVSRKKRIL